MVESGVMNQPPPGPPAPQGYAPQGYAPQGGLPPGDAFQLGQIAAEIKNQATASIIVGIFGLFCFGIILGPFAIYRGTKALNLIQQYGIGQEHATKATVGRAIGIVVLALWLIGIPVRLALSR